MRPPFRIALAVAVVGLCGWAVLFAREAARESATAATPRPQATLPQYLPWPAGRTVHVIQGNNGLPTHSRPTTRYGWDFGLRFGERVLLGIEGMVTRVGTGCRPIGSWGCNGGYGNTVQVRVADGTCTRFEHLAYVTVQLGQWAPLGTLVGYVGSSGNSTGWHLHYQREDCDTFVALPSRFAEAGVPGIGQDVTSALPGVGSRSL